MGLLQMMQLRGFRRSASCMDATHKEHCKLKTVVILTALQTRDLAQLDTSYPIFVSTLLARSINVGFIDLFCLYSS